MARWEVAPRQETSNEIMIRQHVGFEDFEYECVAQCTSGTLTTILH